MPSCGTLAGRLCWIGPKQCHLPAQCTRSFAVCIHLLEMQRSCSPNRLGLDHRQLLARAQQVVVLRSAPCTLHLASNVPPNNSVELETETKSSLKNAVLRTNSYEMCTQVATEGDSEPASPSCNLTVLPALLLLKVQSTTCWEGTMTPKKDKPPPDSPAL